MSNNIIEIASLSEFEDFIQNKKCIIDFWAHWCTPCKQLMITLDDIASKYSDLYFIKIDVEKFPDISSKYFVTSLPAVFFLDDSKVVKQIIGNVDKKKIMSVIEEYMS